MRAKFESQLEKLHTDLIEMGAFCEQAISFAIGALIQNDITLAHKAIDIEKCITCCACIKNCPQSARSMKPGMVKDASVRLHTLYSQRKEPEYFI